MFENNNKKVIKRLAKRSLHANRRRNILVIATIALAVCLLTFFAIFAIGMNKVQKSMEKDRAQIVFTGVSENVIEKISKEPDVEWAGKYINLGAKKYGSSILKITYGDSFMLNSENIKFDGKMPQQDNEIFVQPAMLRHIKANGKAISLNLGNGDQVYHIAGLIVPESADTGQYAVIVSKNCAGKLLRAENINFDAYIRFRNAAGISESEARQRAHELSAKYNISQSKTVIRKSFFNTMHRDISDSVATQAAAGVLILMAAAIVIYCMFFISISIKTQEYGQLRTIGTVRKQIKQLVYHEGIYLSGIGIPIGLAAGCLIGFAVVPKGWDLLSAVVISLFVSLIVFLCVMFSIRAPAKMAAGVSPIEAAHYTACNEKKTSTKKLHRRFSPANLASIYFFRNKKKSLLTILSFGLGGILFMCTASLTTSFNAEGAARRSFPYGEYQIRYADTGGFSEAESDPWSTERIQKNNPLGIAFRNRIQKISGVKDVKVWNSTGAEYTLSDGSTLSGFINGFSREWSLKMKPKLQEGSLDYDMLISKNGLAACMTSTKAKIGDKVKLTLQKSDGSRITKIFTVMALIQNNPNPVGASAFVIPDESLKQLTGMDCAYVLEIVTDNPQAGTVGEKLQALAGNNSSLSFESYKDELAYQKASNRIYFYMLYGITIFISLFGLLNLVNTIVTNMITRKKELSMLQATGLSSRQLRKMLQMEGFMYIIGTFLLTLTVGTLLGYITCRICAQAGMVIVYSFPIIPAVLFFAILTLVQLIISSGTIHMFRRQPLVERIRNLY